MCLPLLRPAQHPTPAGPEPVPFPPNELAWKLYIGIAIPLAVALPMAWLVLPSPAGRLARGCLARALRALGLLGSEALELLLADAGDGRPANTPGYAAAGVQRAEPPGDAPALPTQTLQTDTAIREGGCSAAPSCVPAASGATAERVLRACKGHLP